MKTAIVNARSMGAIAATLPLALLIAGSALVGGSWANESPDAEPSAPVEEVEFTEDFALEGEVTLPGIEPRYDSAT